MKSNRFPLAFCFVLALILALSQQLLTGQKVLAIQQQTGLWRALTHPSREREDPIIHNLPEGLSEDAWDRILDQLQSDNGDLSLVSKAAGGYMSTYRALDLHIRADINQMIFFQAAKLTAYDAADTDLLGGSVTISGTTVFVGASGKDGLGHDRGAVYIFERNHGGTGSWGLLKELTASDSTDDDIFSSSVAISGNTFVVGACWKNDAGLERGAAYVYERNQGGPNNWGEVQKLTASDAQDVDWFGCSVAISGDRIIVGAYYEDGWGSNQGAAYIYGRDQGGLDNWGQVKKLTASDAANQDGFGRSVSISGDTIVVGAFAKNGTGSLRGAAYIYERNQGGTSSWGQVKKLTAYDAADEDLFGLAVTIDGDTAVIGAPREDGTGSDRGATYIYERNQDGANNWGFVLKLTASDTADNDWFGDAVVISGDIVIVGADWKGINWSTRGNVYIFDRNQGGVNSWGQVHKLRASDAGDGDFFGRSVAISGDSIVVGALQEDGAGSNRGAAYVFELRQAYTINLPLVVRNH